MHKYHRNNVLGVIDVKVQGQTDKRGTKDMIKKIKKKSKIP